LSAFLASGKGEAILRGPIAARSRVRLRVKICIFAFKRDGVDSDMVVVQVKRENSTEHKEHVGVCKTTTANETRRRKM